MKKRVLSLVMAFVLSFSMMPMSAFAEEAGAVTEQETQNSENTADVSTIGEETTGEDTAEVTTTSGGNAVTKDAAVEAAQALINALPEEVTAENADALQAQLIAIDEALAALDEAQTAKLDMTRLENVSAALNVAVAAQDGTTHKSHPICGAACTGHNDGNLEHEVVEDWIPLSCDANGGLLKNGEEVKPSGDAYKEYYLYDGNYYLAGDLKLNAVITFNGESSLCLNGHSITRETTGGAIRIPSSVNNNKSLSLCDCVNDGNGYITSEGGDGVAVGKSPFNMYGGIIKGCGKSGVSPNGTGGTFNMFGGEITANTGRGVTMEGTSATYNKATFNMYGGEISNNGGGGVKITKGTFTMSGGEIKGNSANEGGGVYADSDSTFTMSGGEITGNNTTGNSSGSVYVGSNSLTVSGTAKIQNNWIGGTQDNGVYVKGNDGKAGNVYLPNGKKITIGDSGLEEGASIGVTYGGTIDAATDATIATGANKVYSIDSITSDSGYNVWKVDDELRLTTASLDSHPICGKECTDGNHSNEVWKGISDPTKITSDGNYYLMDNVKLTGTWECANNVKLCLNGYTITGASGYAAIEVASGASLDITDCQASAGQITHKSDVSGCGIDVSGSLTLWNGDITGNTDTSGGGVAVTSGSFIMNGGTITQNTADSTGGGVYVASNGTFTMNGGSIAGNTSTSHGGGVYASGNFNMNGGTITGNNTNTGKENIRAGGVYVATGAKFMVSGAAKIINNWKNGKLSNNMYVQGENSTAGNVYLTQNTTFTVGEGLTKDAQIGVSISMAGLPAAGNDVKIATEATNSQLDYTKIFQLDVNDPSYTVIRDEDNNLSIYNHQHNWIYESSADYQTIMAHCDVTGCPNPKGGMVNISKPQHEVYGDGKTAEATLTPVEWQADKPSVIYRKGNDTLTEAPTDAGTYTASITLGRATARVNYTIDPKELTIKGVTVGDKDYDGKTEATITGVTFDGLVNSDSLTEGTDYTVTGNFADAAVGANKDVTVKVELSDSVKNYTFADGAKSAESTATGREIKKATVQNPAAINYTIIKGATKTYAIKLPGLPTLADPREYGTCTYNNPTVSWSNGYDGKVNLLSNAGNNVLTLGITSGSAIGDAGTITVVVTTENYEEITLTVNITATDKIIPQLVTGTLKLTPAEITYGEKLENITISGTMMTDGLEEISGTFVWENPDKILDAGNQEARWKFIPADTQTYAETTGTTTVKVNKAEQSGVVSMDNYTYNETPKTPALTNQKGDPNATVTYYYSTTRTNSGGTEWKNIGPTTLNAGTYYMYAVIGATGNYNAYTTEAKAFEVWKAAPIYTKPSGLTAKYGQKLSEIKLPNPAGNMSGTWNWEAPDTVIDKTGTVSYDAYFTPDDTNYKKVVGAAIVITVTPGDGRNLATEELKLAFNDSTDHTYTPDWSGLPAGQTWNYECESSISNGSKATLTKLNVSAANGELTYAVSGGKAGDEITVILKARCNNYEDFTITLNIRITKALPTGAPKYTLITAEGKNLADAGLTLTDSTLKPAAGKLEWMDEAGNVLTDDTEVKVNTIYWWRFTPTDTNYDPLTGKVELYHVDAPAISAQPKSVSVTAGEKAAFEVTATGTDVTYQWKIDRNDGKGFVDITGATGAAYTTGVTDKDCNGFKYQCVISNAAGSVTTDTVVLTVKEKYTITATAGAHGSISPSGNVEVLEGSSQIFVITAEDGYEIDSLTVDGKAVDAATSYTFENVAAAHTIAVTFKQQYKIIDGADSSWNQDTDGSGSIKIRGNGEFFKFVNVKVDGTIVDPANYTASEGSTIIELHADYLKTLSEGNHTFEIAWTDGTAKTSFTVAKNTSGSDDTGNNDNDDSNKDSNNDSSNNNSGSNTAGSGDNTAQTLTGSPNTGDASGLWITLFLASAAGLAVMLVRRKNSIKK